MSGISDHKEDHLTQVGNLDLAEIPILDIQVHPMRRERWSDLCEKRIKDVVDYQLPDPLETPYREAVVGMVRAGAAYQVRRSPRHIGYLAYVARTHGVPATDTGMDAVVDLHIGDDFAFSSYVASVLDRERIGAVIVQAPDLVATIGLTDASTRSPHSFFPAARSGWTFSFLTLLDPNWARSNEASSIRGVLALIDETMEKAVSNGCVGFKSNGAYTRSFRILPVSEAEAERAMQALLTSDLNNGNRSSLLTIYQDYLIRHIYVRAGLLDRPILLHVAVALNPVLRIEFNDPAPLYDIFRDPEIRAAGTRFVLKNTGYPMHDLVTAMASQFPNVYVDVTFFAQYPASVDHLYRGLLAIAPSEKILYGSDIPVLPEGVGYSASTTRIVLAAILRDYQHKFGYSSDEVARIAHNILHANAERVFGMQI